MPPRLLQQNGESYTHLHQKNELIWKGLRATNIMSLAHYDGIYVVNT
jgi:aryl carrier-like protein